MNRVTLAVVAVLLAVPAVAQAKAGIEFDNAIETQKSGEKQQFTAMVLHEPRGPDARRPEPVRGVRPLVTFTNTRTGAAIRVRTSRTDIDGVASGTVTFPDDGPWRATLSVNGKPFGDSMHGQTFELDSLPPVNVVDTIEPPANTPKPDDGGSGFPAWLLSFPAAGLAALGIWRLRKRPRELGA